MQQPSTARRGTPPLAAFAARSRPSTPPMRGMDALLSPNASPQRSAASPSPKRVRQSPMRIDQVSPAEEDANDERQQQLQQQQPEDQALAAVARGDAFLSGRYKPRRTPARSATLELRELRQDVAHMGGKMRALSLKWRAALPDARVRLRALEAAKARWVMAQAEAVNRSLKDQLLQQQLFLAALQRRVADSPLLAPSRSREMFEALHSFVELPGDLAPATRAERLNAHCELGERVAPAALDRFTRALMDRPPAGDSPVSAHTSIMADGRHTFVSSLLVGRLPRTTLREALDASAHYFSALPAEMSRRGIVAQSELTLLEKLDGTRSYSRLHYRYGSHFVTNTNTTRSLRVSGGRAVVVIDFIDRDDLHPTATRPGDLLRDSTLVMMMTEESDPATGAPCVLLQRINAIRYNLPPQSPLLHDEVRATLPVLNGDLFMEVVCRHMMEKTQQQQQQLSNGH